MLDHRRRRRSRMFLSRYVLKQARLCAPRVNFGSHDWIHHSRCRVVVSPILGDDPYTRYADYRACLGRPDNMHNRASLKSVAAPDQAMTIGNLLSIRITVNRASILNDLCRQLGVTGHGSARVVLGGGCIAKMVVLLTSTPPLSHQRRYGGGRRRRKW